MPGPVSATRSTSRSSDASAADRDRATGRGVPHPVRDEVGEHLAEPDRVDVDDREIGRDVGRDGHPGRARGALERPHDLVDQHVRIGRLRVQLERAGLRQRHRPQVVDEARHDPRLVEDRRQVRLVGRVDAVDHRLEVAGDDGQRGAQLVAHVVEQRAPLVLVALEPLDHRVEAADQLAHRAPAAGRGSTRIV